jgi:hypothetical protein
MGEVPLLTLSVISLSGVVVTIVQQVYGDDDDTVSFPDVTAEPLLDTIISISSLRPGAITLASGYT